MKTLSLKTFFDALDQRLSQMSAEEMRRVLRQMGENASHGERQAFLEQLAPPVLSHAKLSQAPGQNLLEDIESLKESLEEACKNGEEWADIYGWERFHDDDDGDLCQFEEHVSEMSACFERAQAAFDYGDMKLAKAAYEALFPLLDMEDEYGHGIRIGDLEGVDSAETASRYLRALYECTPLSQRAEAVWQGMCNVKRRLSKPHVTLDDLIQISQKPLIELEDFLPLWIARLSIQEGFAADQWLREAIKMQSGMEGLAVLARQEGQKRPHAYLDWLKLLEEKNRYDEMMSTALEAFTQLPTGMPIRAAIADHYCRAAKALGDELSLRAGLWEAFAAQPNLERLLDLWEDNPKEKRRPMMDRVLEHLQAYLEKTEQQESPSSHYDEDPLSRQSPMTETRLTHAFLLSGSWQKAFEQAKQGEEALGSNSSNSTQGLVMGFLLVKLAGNPPVQGLLRVFWQERLSGTLWMSDQHLFHRLEKRYEESLAEMAWSEEEQQKALAWCLDKANQRVEAIVGGARRSSYGKAAILTAACAEMLHCRGQQSQAALFVGNIRKSFSRHRAFQTELDKVCRK